MDEFDKIRELSEELDAKKENKPETEDSEALDDDAELYHFRSDYRERLAQASEEEGTTPFFKQRKVLIIGALLISVGIGALFFRSSKQQEDVPVITPTANPVKVVPESPGGMEIPDQDKVIYDRLRQQTLDAKIESLFPEAEQPVAPQVEEEPIVDGMPAIGTETPEVSTEIQAPVEPQPTVTTEKLDLPQQTTPQAKKTEPKAPKKESKPATTAASGESWSVQLMSSSNKATVQKAWPTLQEKHKALLSGMSYVITEAQIAGKGTFYRLRVGKFASRDQAAALCAKLKARKQDCVPAK